MKGVTRETVCLLETQLDDVTGETMGHAMDRLFEAGALEVFMTPVQMKKNRPGIALTVVARIEEEETFVEQIFKLCPTLGVRTQRIDRYVLTRSVKTVKLPEGTVRVKIAGEGQYLKIHPEYTDCAKLAQITGKSLNSIIQEVVAAWQSQHPK